MAFLPAETFILLTGADRLTSYLFNKHVIRHQFCSICGCETHAEGVVPGGVRTTAVNLRCVPSIDLDALAIEKVDGARF
ncbi:glutathione-dependent formaldehyde-activating protein [Sphingomonas sp.]|uniref:glutathione-dependent formaldehyde-activating protein n=1 Tax=Sphingomonas sp. TaxID=28214 RepID=UPI00344F4AF0